MDSYRVIASPKLPPNEITLRGLRGLGGEALDDIEPILEQHCIASCDYDDGVQTIIGILTPAFAERECRKNAGISSFERFKHLDSREEHDRPRGRQVRHRYLGADTHPFIEAARHSAHVKTTLLSTAVPVYDFNASRTPSRRQVRGQWLSRFANHVAPVGQEEQVNGAAARGKAMVKAPKKSS